jgi:sterol desaturase/sphingolipid hydroxylase (fatty acid hydroxylase superfamily)
LIPGWQLAVSFAIALSIGAGVGIAVEELRWMRRRGRLTRAAVREMVLSLSSLPPNVVTSIVLAGAWLALYGIVSKLAPLHIDTGFLTLLPALLLADFCYYLEHRAAHRWRLLWVMYHGVHHSSPDYTVATAYRVSFVNQLVAPLFYLPCILAGFEPLLVVGLQVFAIHYQAWVHTRAIGALPLLDAVFNTPANHRMHHDYTCAARGVNFGGVLVLWDRLFGTYSSPRPVRAFGIAGCPAPRNWHELYTAPFTASRSERRPAIR